MHAIDKFIKQMAFLCYNSILVQILSLHNEHDLCLLNFQRL